jgi:hypothetical protein
MKMRPFREILRRVRRLESYRSNFFLSNRKIMFSRAKKRVFLFIL